jgi:hypothetical protein
MSRFDDLDEVPVPNQWGDILRRAEHPEPVVVAHRMHRRRRRPHLALTAAAVLVVCGAVGVVAASRPDGRSTVTTDAHPGADRTTSVPEEDPTLVCPGGGLVMRTVPKDASPSASSFEHVAEDRFMRSWDAGGLHYELLVSDPGYVDFVGMRTKEVDRPSGTLLFEDGATRLVGTTSLGIPCDLYELIATGADEATREAGVLRVASGFEVDESLAVTDCGPLSPATLQEMSGEHAGEVLAAATIGDVPLGPVAGGPIPSITRRADGRCTATVLSPYGLHLTEVISGRDGRYGLDSVNGAVLDGPPSGDAESQDIPISMQIQGRRYSVMGRFSCEECATTTLTLAYPDDGIVATATGSGPFSGELERPSTPGAHGTISLVWRASDGSPRAIATATFPSGDFAAG